MSTYPKTIKALKAFDKRSASLSAAADAAITEFEMEDVEVQLELAKDEVRRAYFQDTKKAEASCMKKDITSIRALIGVTV